MLTGSPFGLVVERPCLKTERRRGTAECGKLDKRSRSINMAGEGCPHSLSVPEDADDTNDTGDKAEKQSEIFGDDHFARRTSTLSQQSPAPLFLHLPSKFRRILPINLQSFERTRGRPFFSPGTRQRYIHELLTFQLGAFNRPFQRSVSKFRYGPVLHPKRPKSPNWCRLYANGGDRFLRCSRDQSHTDFLHPTLESLILYEAQYPLFVDRSISL